MTSLLDFYRETLIVSLHRAGKMKIKSWQASAMQVTRSRGGNVDDEALLPAKKPLGLES